MSETHWYVMWVLTRDDKAVEGSHIRVPFYVKVPDSTILITAGTTTPVPQETRIELAVEQAQERFRRARRDTEGWI